MGRPIQLAALKMVIPGGTRVILLWGLNSMVTLVAALARGLSVMALGILSQLPLYVNV
jgi:hypothetical protein